MKVTYNWLKEYIDLNVSPYDLIDIFGKLGMPVEEFVDFRKGKENLKIAEIVNIEKHKNSDKLYVLKLKTKDEEVKIVSGAPYLEKGKKVIYAPPGTKLEEFEVGVGL